MATPLSIVVLNSSVIMAGIACALGEREDLCVHMIRRIEDLHADDSPEKHEILILDIAAVPAERMLATVRQYPSMSVLGIDIHGGNAFAFSSSNYPLYTTQDLTDLIRRTDDFVCKRPDTAAQHRRHLQESGA